jgi:hypothetical protein
MLPGTALTHDLLFSTSSRLLLRRGQPSCGVLEVLATMLSLFALGAAGLELARVVTCPWSAMLLWTPKHASRKRIDCKEHSL